MILSNISTACLYPILVVFLTFFYSDNAHAEQAPRININVYHFDGVENDELRKYFSQYKGILKRRISHISSNLSNTSRGEEFQYLRNLKIIESAQEAGSIKHREEVWKGTNTLQLLSGIVFDQGDSITVMTQVYLGLLPEYLKKSLIEIELNVSPEEYRKTRDIYSALTLYTILVDAMDKKPAYIASQYLSETKNYISDLDQLAPLTIELNDALKKAEQILKNRSSSLP